MLANELAPRVHNSGHWTIEGSETSQFENHLRAILGMPLGSTEMRGHAGMVNCIGTMPDPAAVAEIPGAHLHDYEKEPRPGRKLGHITVVADTADRRDVAIDRRARVGLGDGARRAELRDLVGGETPVGEDLVGVLAGLRRRPA